MNKVKGAVNTTIVTADNVVFMYGHWLFFSVGQTRLSLICHLEPLEGYMQSEPVENSLNIFLLFPNFCLFIPKNR